MTPEHAQREYGVVLEESEGPGAWTLDVSATERLHGRMRAEVAD